VNDYFIVQHVVSLTAENIDARDFSLSETEEVSRKRKMRSNQLESGYLQVPHEGEISVVQKPHPPTTPKLLCCDEQQVNHDDGVKSVVKKSVKRTKSLNERNMAISCPQHIRRRGSKTVTDRTKSQPSCSAQLLDQHEEVAKIVVKIPNSLKKSEVAISGEQDIQSRGCETITEKAMSQPLFSVQQQVQHDEDLETVIEKPKSLNNSEISFSSSQQIQCRGSETVDKRTKSQPSFCRQQTLKQGEVVETVIEKPKSNLKTSVPGQQHVQLDGGSTFKVKRPKMAPSSYVNPSKCPKSAAEVVRNIEARQKKPDPTWSKCLKVHIS